MKACKQCRFIFEEGDTCPLCNSHEVSEKFNSQLIIFDVNNSELAKKVSAKVPGKYAVRIK